MIERSTDVGGSMVTSLHLDSPHILWIGCGDLLRRTKEALQTLREIHSAKLCFLDIFGRDDVRQPPPEGSEFFNIRDNADRHRFREYSRATPLNSVFVANLPPQHLLTAFKFSELCNGGKIVISKPLDTNFALIDTIGSGAWPEITKKIFVHDHYRNKGAVEPVYFAFPRLIETYGMLRSFEGYLVEHGSIEDEGRLNALNDGVIFDLASHLYALVQLFFLRHPNPAIAVEGSTVVNPQLIIKRVARARYAKCRLKNQNAETFAAIEVEVRANVQHSAGVDPFSVDGLLVVGKGVKPSQSISAGLKGLRFKQELQTRSVNLTRNEVNPPLSDLQFAGRKINWRENGFHDSVVTALSTVRRKTEILNPESQGISPEMDFSEAAENSKFLAETISMGSKLVFYQVGDTLETVLAKCVGAGHLSHRWLSEAGYADIGFG